MTIHPEVVITTQSALRELLKETEERGRQRGLTEAAGKIDPTVELRLHRLKEALLLCSHAASGDRLAWEGSRYPMPDGGSSSDYRVNRVGEIVQQFLESDPMDTHRGNESLAYQDAARFYVNNPDIEPLSWFGRMVRRRQHASATGSTAPAPAPR